MDMLARAALHLTLLLLVAPLLQGVIVKTKALFAGRVGAPLLQPYHDLNRLLRKECVFSRTTSWVFLAGPVAGVAVPMLAALVLPFGALPAPIAFTGDLLLFVYLFGVARFLTVASALDTGSSFEGMGGAREVTFSCLAEPIVLFCLIVLARIAGSLSLTGLFGPHLATAWRGATGLSLGLVVICLLVVLLAENSRIPFDDPNTHLELTMVHEVMVLDHSGPPFALVLYGAALKLMVLGAPVVRLLLPVSTGFWAGDAILFLLGMLALAVLIGVIESIMARLRLVRIPQVLIGTTMLSGFALILVLR